MKRERLHTLDSDSLTTLREHLEQGTFEPFRKFFETYKGSIPLCCYDMKKDKKGNWLIRCHWLKDWMSMEKFHKKCAECQKEMEVKLHGN